MKKLATIGLMLIGATMLCAVPVSFHVSQQNTVSVALDTAAARIGRVEMWRGGCRSNISVSAPFVWRCLSGSTMAPFPHPAHRTGQADFPHPALGQDFTP